MPNITDNPSKTKPIRILRLIARLNVGGPAKLMAWVMNGLDENEFQQTLACGQVEPDEDDLGPWVRSKGVDFVILPQMGRSISPKKDIKTLCQVFKLLCQIKPHILTTDTSKAGFIGRSALILYRPWAFLSGYPVPKAVHTFHGHTFKGYFSPLAEKVFLFLEKALAYFATWKIVVISPQQYEEIHHTFKVGKKKQFTILPLGIDLDEFSNPEKGRKSFRQEFDVKDSEILIGAVGRIACVKNYDLFLEAALSLSQIKPDIFAKTKFAIIGGGSKEDISHLREKARQYNIDQQVIFCGNRRDPEAFIPALDILMLTSLNEGTPLAILEAGALSCPVLATEVGGVVDLLGKPDNNPQLACGLTKRARGLGAQTQNALALAQGLNWLITNKDKAHELSLALHKFVLKHHTKEKMVQHLKKLYREAKTYSK